MPLANLYNRLCCQQAPLGSTDFRAGARALVIAVSRALRIARTLVRGAKYAFHRDADDLDCSRLSASNRGAVGAAAASCVWIARYPPGVELRRVDRSRPFRAARSKPAPAYSAETRALRNLPLTPLLSRRPMWAERVSRSDDARQREPFRSRAAEHRDSMIWSTE